jgi:hypothetical protein
MLKYFILAVLFLILYQFVGYVIEGLEGEDGGGNTTSATNTSSGDSSSGGSGNCGMSLTDRNVFLLNDRVNALQVQYSDLSGNIVLLNKQMEDLMKQNENAASEMVGNEPLDISTGGNDMPETVGGEGDSTTAADNTNTNETAMTSAT